MLSSKVLTAFLLLRKLVNTHVWLLRICSLCKFYFWYVIFFFIKVVPLGMIILSKAFRGRKLAGEYD